MKFFAFGPRNSKLSESKSETLNLFSLLFGPTASNFEIQVFLLSSSWFEVLTGPPWASAISKFRAIQRGTSRWIFKKVWSLAVNLVAHQTISAGAIKRPESIFVCFIWCTPAYAHDALFEQSCSAGTCCTALLPGVALRPEPFRLLNFIAQVPLQWQWIRRPSSARKSLSADWPNTWINSRPWGGQVWRSSRSQRTANPAAQMNPLSSPMWLFRF